VLVELLEHTQQEVVELLVLQVQWEQQVLLVKLVHLSYVDLVEVEVVQLQQMVLVQLEVQGVLLVVVEAVEVFLQVLMLEVMVV
jgi:hypothetical protein